MTCHTKKEKKALRYLMFLKEKRDGTIKARGCADGRPQRIYTGKRRYKLTHRINRGNECHTVVCFIILLTLLPGLFFQPALSVFASLTVFGKGSFFCSTLFSIWSCILPYFCLSTLYINTMVFSSSLILSIALLSWVSVGFVTFLL